MRVSKITAVCIIGGLLRKASGEEKILIFSNVLIFYPKSTTTISSLWVLLAA
ncbi:MAG: hypothetical protein ACJAYG_001068 [Oceanicoccus sp.]|jgi:hypothetical protein